MIQRKYVEITKTYAFLKISHISILILMLFTANLFADNPTDRVYKVTPSVNKLFNKSMTADSIPNFIFGYYKNKTLMFMNGESKVFSDFDDTIGYSSASGYDAFVDSANRVTYLVNSRYTNVIFDGEKLFISKDATPFFSFTWNTSQYHFYIDEEWVYTQKPSYRNQKVNTFMNIKTNDVFSAYPDEIIGFGENTIITTYNNESVSLWSFTGELKYELKNFSSAKLEYPDNPNKGWMIDRAYFIDPFIIIEGEVINMPYFRIAHINNQPPVIIDTRTDEAFFAPYGYHLFAVPTKE